MADAGSARVHWWRRLLGPQLVNCASLGEKPTEQVLGGCVEVVGLLLTPSGGPSALSERLRRLLPAINASTLRLQMVQVLPPGASRDQLRHATEGDPWFTLPPHDDLAKARVWRRWGGAPCAEALVLLDVASGRPLARDAAPRLGASRSDGDERTLLAAFPWCDPPPLALLTGADAPLQRANDRSPAPADAVARAHVLGLYFSANWCPPCKAFTPRLVQLYARAQECGHRFEVVFVSSDRSEESFALYASGMPWLAVPWRAERRRRELAALLAVRGIPALVLLDAATGALMARDGRALVLEDPHAQDFPWLPKLVNNLTDRFVAKLQDYPAIILFIEGAFEDEEARVAEALLLPAAEDYFGHLQPSEEDDYLHFFIACDGGAGDAVREALGLEDGVPLLAAVDLPCGRLHALDAASEVSAAAVAAFVADFLNDSLPALPAPTAPAAPTAPTAHLHVNG